MRALQVDPCDNVAVVAQAVAAGDNVQVGNIFIEAKEDIMIGHKIALCDIAEGELVKKYGVPIGKATVAIMQGTHVHTHNIEDITEQLCKEYADEFRRKAGVL